MRYDLAKMATRKGARRTVILNPITGRVAAETALRRIILSVLREAEQHRPSLLAAAVRTRSELTMDGAFDDVMRIFRGALSALSQAARHMVERLFKIEAVRHDARWIEQVNAAIGVDLSSVISQADVAPSVDIAVQRSVALITGLTDELAKRVETTILKLLTEGKATRAIAKALSDQFGWSKKRAALIARDQAAKFNGNLNRIRQQQAGIDSYIWWTVQDERVRGNPDGRYPNAKPSHFDRHGRTFRWDASPNDGHPGEPINCRCIPRPVLEI